MTLEHSTTTRYKFQQLETKREKSRISRMKATSFWSERVFKVSRDLVKALKGFARDGVRVGVAGFLELF
jgi:hypothetical protein